MCARRSGKSTALGIMIVKTALENPGCNIHYVGNTSGAAFKIMVKDILGPIKAKHALDIRFVQNPPRAVFGNGSICWMVGAATNEAERQKIRGTKNKLIVVDEVQSFQRVDVDDMIKSTLRPTLKDERGSMVMTGTPGEGTSSYWYKAVHDQDPELTWSRHKWLGTDNPHMREQCLEELKSWEQHNPAYLRSNKFKREELGQWVADIESRIYQHHDHNLNVESVPPGQLYYVLGVDLGFKDAFACVLVAYAPHDRRLFVVETFQQRLLHIHEQVDAIKKFKSRFPIWKIVVDCANPQVIDEMKYRWALNMEPTKKTGTKAEWIDLMNSDLAESKVKLLPAAAMALVPEWERLTWDIKALQEGERKTRKAAKDHLSDALLYAWRFARNWAAVPMANTRRLTLDEQEAVVKKQTFERMKKMSSGDVLDIDEL